MAHNRRRRRPPLHGCPIYRLWRLSAAQQTAVLREWERIFGKAPYGTRHPLVVDLDDAPVSGGQVETFETAGFGVIHLPGKFREAGLRVIRRYLVREIDAASQSFSAIQVIPADETDSDSFLLGPVRDDPEAYERLTRLINESWDGPDAPC